MKKIQISMLLGALLTLGKAAEAAGPAAGEWVPQAAQNRIGLDYELWPAADALGMVWGANAQIQVRDKLFVDADFAFGYTSFEFFGSRFNQAAYGNLTGGAHYADFLSPTLSFHLGGTLTLPLLHDPTDKVAFAAAVLTVTRGYVDAYRLVPGSMPLRFGGGVEYRIMPNLFYRGTFMPTIYISVRSGVDTEFFIDQVNEIDYRLDMGVRFGARLQEAFTLTTSDLVQLALEPFVGYQSPEAGLFARVGLFVALDKSAGFGFDQNKLATLRFAGGYHW